MSANEHISGREGDFQQVIDRLKEDISSLRTGRANPTLVENIQVEAYDTRTPIMGLASITTPDARTISIEPWDKSVVQAIEKAIREANIGLTPAVQGSIIRVSIPTLTEEGRKDLLKVLGDKLEQARIGVRKIRDDIRSGIVEAEKNKEITEDDKYKAQESLDKTTGEWNEKIKQVGEEKEKEIMTI